jgi:hypothetical protein
MANNQSITISQRKRINNHVSNLIINTNNNNNNTNHVSYNTNTNLIPTTTSTSGVVANTHLDDNNNNNNEVSLDISNIRKKVDSKLNTSLITNNFTRNEVASSNTNEQHTKKITPIIMCVIPTETIKDDEMISERKDLTTNTYHNNKKPSKCKVSCDRICIIRFLCIFVISFSLFLFLKWKLHF